MANINPYLTFNGNCFEAFEFYKSVFGGDYPYVGKFDEMPGDDFKIPEDQKDRIMHMSLPIGNGCILMGSDALGGDLTKGDNFTISINTTSKDEADQLFNGLSKDGQITMAMSNAFWGSYFGSFVDKFGVQWMVNCELPKE